MARAEGRAEPAFSADAVLAEVAERLRTAARDMIAKANAIDGQDYRLVRLVKRKPRPIVIEGDEEDAPGAPGQGGEGRGETGEGVAR